MQVPKSFVFISFLRMWLWFNSNEHQCSHLSHLPCLSVGLSASISFHFTMVYLKGTPCMSPPAQMHATMISRRACTHPHASCLHTAFSVTVSICRINLVDEANERHSIVSCCVPCYHPALFMECQLSGSGLAFGGTTEKIRLT